METQKISVEEIGKTQSELDHDRGLQGTITVQGHVDDIGCVSVVYYIQIVIATTYNKDWHFVLTRRAFLRNISRPGTYVYSGRQKMLCSPAPLASAGGESSLTTENDGRTTSWGGLPTRTLSQTCSWSSHQRYSVFKVLLMTYYVLMAYATVNP